MSTFAQRSALLRADWTYVEKPTLEVFRVDDWVLLNDQRRLYQGEQQATQVLRLLAISAGDPTFGYQINNYRHCLQSATLALRDGLDEETVGVCLLHDVGFHLCPEMHAEFAAALLGAYVSERNHWMLLRHAIFQQFHIHEHADLDRNARERWRGHPHFEWAAAFVERYDQNAIDPDHDDLPLAVFEPMVRRLFARSLAPKPLDV